MKKCASCTKDLPDAALHCVFCGAKQAPAPAAQPGMAKTVMGYGGNEELDRLREQAAAQNAARSNAPAKPAFTPAAPSPSGFTPTPGPRPSTPSSPPPAGYAPGALAPVAGAQARTMFVDGPPPAVTPAATPNAGAFSPGGSSPPPSNVGSPSSGYNPQPASYSPPASGYNPQPAQSYSPQAVAPIPPVPTAPAPYMAPGHNARQAARPIEPWKDSLRTTMFIWGGVLLACFAVPISISPLLGYWNFVLDGEGTAKLMPLILAAVGLLSIVVGGIPMSAGPRGAIAAVLALSGIFVPVAIAGALPEWTSLVSMAGTLLLVPALLMRNEYTESPMPRILVTLGALATLVPFLVPQHGAIPIVGIFQLLIDAPGTLKIFAALIVAYIVVVVLTLLAWMPSPATAGAKALAWLIMLFPLIFHAAGILLSGGEGVDFEHALNPTILGWAYGASGKGITAGMGALGLGTAYVAISSYGLASLLGKNLE